ncbi:hypothetical protein KTS45_01370 [Halomicroarcula limicola]|uniref:DUF7344 domain-containing protein n=1 Tax=Haloarcula limicola TaxID=1429915 RepID=A0A8J7YAA9_9EURY|nr:hypothetical protein [Halomicroarcula limicola]MBV0922838.1 hypothetical protein [Halomicroarcula limicola]
MADEHTDNTASEAPAGVSLSEIPSPKILELDHVYKALAHPRRRYLCYTLLEDAEWSLSDLATKIAAWEQDARTGDVTERQRERVYVSLYHAHVPKLVEDNIVTFDEAGERISVATNAKQVLSALEGMGASLDANQEAHARGEDA